LSAFGKLSKGLYSFKISDFYNPISAGDATITIAFLINGEEVASNSTTLTSFVTQTTSTFSFPLV